MQHNQNRLFLIVWSYFWSYFVCTLNITLAGHLFFTSSQKCADLKSQTKAHMASHPHKAKNKPCDYQQCSWSDWTIILLINVAILTFYAPIFHIHEINEDDFEKERNKKRPKPWYHFVRHNCKHAYDLSHKSQCDDKRFEQQIWIICSHFVYI